MIRKFSELVNESFVERDKFVSEWMDKMFSEFGQNEELKSEDVLQEEETGRRDVYLLPIYNMFDEILPFDANLRHEDKKYAYFTLDALYYDNETNKFMIEYLCGKQYTFGETENICSIDKIINFDEFVSFLNKIYDVLKREL